MLLNQVSQNLNATDTGERFKRFFCQHLIITIVKVMNSADRKIN